MAFSVFRERIANVDHVRIGPPGRMRAPDFGTLVMPPEKADELLALLNARPRARDLLAARGWRGAALRLVALVRAALGTRGGGAVEGPAAEWVGEFGAVLDEPRAQPTNCGGGVDVWRMLGPKPSYEDEPPPFVCPGCHAVGGERCAPGCVDASIEEERARREDVGDDDEPSEGDAVVVATTPPETERQAVPPNADDWEGV